MRLAPTLVCLFLASCALAVEDPATTAERPRALLDAYLIAHGMAHSYAQTADADPAVVTQLARLDLRAYESVRALASRPDASLAATASAVAALTNYAATAAQ